MNNATKYLGVELGSTRIKSVVIDHVDAVTSSGEHTWENAYENGYWTYSIDDVWAGIKNSVSKVGDKSNIAALGISAMMHGYLAFDKNDNLLVPFRTWRNENAKIASEELTKELGFNIPTRWTVAHFYQAILDEELHIKDVAFVTTLAGYVHWKLTGEKAIGIGDASGIFPIKDGDYDLDMANIFKELSGFDIYKIFPKVLKAGEDAGRLNAKGAKILGLKEGIPLCPPEGDAGTGMVATKSVRKLTGNVSAGTSIFVMTVLDKPLRRIYPEVDIVATPTGYDVAMIHCNECTSKIDPWIKLFGETFEMFGLSVPKDELFSKLYEAALGNGRVAEFMRDILEDAVNDLADGMKILTEQEGVKMNKLMGHGGFFKSGRAGCTILSEKLGIPIEQLPQSAEGGPYGCAILASYLVNGNDKTLEDFIDEIGG